MILIGHGYVGGAIHRELVRRNINHRWITHTEALSSTLKAKSIINCAAYTGMPNIDDCEKNRHETAEGNIVFPVKLEQLNPGTPIVHITTGCVYSGYIEGGWTEEHEPNFTYNTGSFYSGSKIIEQKLLEFYMNKSYLLRIRMPFGSEPNEKNLITKMRRFNKLINSSNTISFIDDVVDVVIAFASKLPTPGIYNVCNPGVVSMREIADAIGLDKPWFTEEEFAKFVAVPRANCNVNVDKLMRVYPIQDIHSALSRCASQMNLLINQ